MEFFLCYVLLDNDTFTFKRVCVEVCCNKGRNLEVDNDVKFSQRIFPLVKIIAGKKEFKVELYCTIRKPVFDNLDQNLNLTS